MLRFAIGYGIWVSLLFILLYIEGLSPLFFISEMQTQLTIQLTEIWISFFHIPVIQQGDTLILEHGMQLQILHECNGLVPYLLLISAILAFPTSLKSKVLWMVIFYGLLLVINMLRIYLITLVVIDSPDLFKISHDWVGRYSVGILTLLLFYWFTNKVTVTSLKR